MTKQLLVLAWLWPLPAGIVIFLPTNDLKSVGGRGRGEWLQKQLDRKMSVVSFVFGYIRRTRSLLFLQACMHASAKVGIVGSFP